MQFTDQLQTFITSILQDKKKLVIVVCVVGFLIIGGILISVFSLGSSEGPSGGNTFSFGAKGDPAPTLIPTQTPEEIAYLTAIPPAPTDIPFITKKDLAEFEPHGSPTPTPLPGVFYIPNGQQNDLQIRYFYDNEGDTFEQIRIANTKTTEERTIGYMYRYTPGDPAFFSKDFSQVYFLGGSKSEFNQVSVYSVARNTFVKVIRLEDMKKALPQLQIDNSAVLSMLVPSPDKTKMAFSYGNTFSTKRIVPDTRIIVININTGKMQLLPVKGLVHGWKDDTTLQYEVNTSDPNINNTLEFPITGI